jgi:Ca2+-binding RTX toxin-like protein
MTTPADPNAFNDDGTPRRRYEIDDNESSGKPILRSSIGIVFFNAFVLIKSLLFAEEAPRASTPAAARGTEAAPKPVEPETIAAAERLDDIQPVSDTEDIEPVKRKGGSTLMLSQPVDFQPEEVPLNRRSSGLPVAGNDNEALYGAAPGSNISIFTPNDTAVGEVPGGHGGADEDPDDPRDDDDEDDDDTDTPDRNRLPVITGPVVLAAAFANQPVSIALADLLRHASDPDGDTLSVRSITSSSGKIERQADGSFVFNPIYGDTSSVTFAYRVSDGSGSVSQVAMLDLVPPETAPIVGTATSDTLLGTPRSDVIYALAGDDLVIGRESGDVIYGGDGNDRILGGEGDDVIYGEGGDDVIFAGPGNDKVFGGDGDDQIFGEEGQDVLLGEEGDDTISGGDDSDTISGGPGDDSLNGDAGNDMIMGDAGRDDIKGGDGDDTIAGGEDDDIVDAGAGDDRVIALASDGNDIYDGGAGSDTYDISATMADALIDLDAETAFSDDIGTDRIFNFEHVQGGGGDDVIVANESPNDLAGGGGDNMFVFKSSAAIGHGAGYRDRILDFEIGDRIDLDEVSKEFADAYEDLFEEQGIKKFVLIREQDEFTRPGQMKIQYEGQDDGSRVLVLAGNTDYDADSEFEIEFVNSYEVSDRDFYWHS